jgi:hypothetical protein
LKELYGIILILDKEDTDCSYKKTYSGKKKSINGLSTVYMFYHQSSYQTVADLWNRDEKIEYTHIDTHFDLWDGVGRYNGTTFPFYFLTIDTTPMPRPASPR